MTTPTAPLPVSARSVAWRLLREVDTRTAYANLTMPGLLRRSGLSVADRRLATEIGYGALRTQGTLDHVLGGVSARDWAEVDPPVRDALRLAAYQVLFTRIPARAAVDSGVELTRAVAGEGAARFANAVLRQVALRATGANPLGAPPAVEDPVGHLAITTCHPRWVVEVFRDALGGDLAETGRALAADNRPQGTHLVARPGRVSPAELIAQAEARGWTAHPGVASPYAVVLRRGEPDLLPAVHDGRAAVQDEASQLVALRLVAAAPPGAVGPGVPTGVTVDLCAGPGGKSVLLAALASPLVAVEPVAVRAGLVRAALAGAGVVVQADGRQPPLRPGSAARVLVDAPCTGLGALRRHPEARWRLRPADVGPLTHLQSELLTAACELLAPGGVVAYATCSPHPAEALEVPARVCASRADMIELPGGHHQWWPHREGTDAMSLTLLRRTAAIRPPLDQEVAHGGH